MTWVTIILILLVVGGIYAYAKKRGERAKANRVMDRETELDRDEIDRELEDKRNNNAWDNLNDTLDDMGK